MCAIFPNENIKKKAHSKPSQNVTKILNELCAVAGFNRKYAIRILAIKLHEGKRRM